MLKESKEGLVYKMDIPVLFYARIVIPFVVISSLFLVKADSELIILSALISLVFTLNTTYFVIEVYENNFKIILPSIWFNSLFKIERKFYYDFVTEYECEIGSGERIASKTEWLFISIGNSMMGHNTGFGMSKDKFSKISFLYTEDETGKTIQRWFSASQTKELTEANKHIMQKLKMRK